MDGTFQLFSSDHCPFRYEGSDGKRNEKGLKSFVHIPNGIPGVETRLPILFSEGVVKGRIDACQFVALTATNHAKTYGLYPRKGQLQSGPMPISCCGIRRWKRRCGTMICTTGPIIPLTKGCT